MGEHRIQVRIDDEAWARAEEAAAQNGLKTVSGLVGLLLHREYERLGLISSARTPRKKKRKRARR